MKSHGTTSEIIEDQLNLSRSQNLTAAGDHVKKCILYEHRLIRWNNKEWNIAKLALSKLFKVIIFLYCCTSHSIIRLIDLYTYTPRKKYHIYMYI